MATLRKGLVVLGRQTRLHLFQLQHNLSTSSAVLQHWNKDWKPGPIPRTPEERAAAAKKYGLRPEDYNVLADGDIGDYPQLPIVAKDRRDPFEDYDFPSLARNYGEPIRPNEDILGEEFWDPKFYGIHKYYQALLQFVLLFTGLIAVNLLLEPYPYFLPQMPKQYPFNNLYLENGGDPATEPEVKHYTFAPANSDES